MPGEPEKAPTVGVMRKALGLVGVPPDLVDAAFLRRLGKATSTLLERANTEDEEDETVLSRLEDDPVAAYRDIDPEVADRLARIRDAAHAGSVPPPDLGQLPKTRRAPRQVRPIVRSCALEEAVDEVRARVLSRAAEDPAGLGSFLDDPAAGVEDVAGGVAHPVRRTLSARRPGTGGTHDDIGPRQAQVFRPDSGQWVAAGARSRAPQLVALELNSDRAKGTGLTVRKLTVTVGGSRIPLTVPADKRYLDLHAGVVVRVPVLAEPLHSRATATDPFPASPVPCVALTTRPADPAGPAVPGVAVVSSDSSGVTNRS